MWLLGDERFTDIVHRSYVEEGRQRKRDKVNRVGETSVLVILFSPVDEM